MTINDFNVGETWITPRGRKVEIVAAEVIETDFDTVHVVVYRNLGMSMVHVRHANDLSDWAKEVE